jgi:hypothetical protein
MPDSPRLTIMVDVDNTLIDNDAAKVEIDRRLVAQAGQEGSARFWDVYEQVRSERGVVDVPLVLARYFDGTADRAQRFALADLFMRFPYEEFLFPESMRTISHLRGLGAVIILSDGDPVFQSAKINRSGLAAAVDGYVLIYPHKEEHMAEVTAAFAADHYVLVEDKPTVIERVTTRLQSPLTTVFLRQGRYAAVAPPGPWAGASLTLNGIGDLQRFEGDELIEAGRR